MGYMNCQTFTISSCFAVECHFDVKLARYLGVGSFATSSITLNVASCLYPATFNVIELFCDMKNATKYLVVGSLGVLMTRRDISSLAVKGLKY